MILSFSVPEMLPYIRSGLLQLKGEQVGGVRVKRQTIRKMGPQAERVLAAPAFPYRLSLWWKSRTKEREFLGSIEQADVKAYPIEIMNYRLVETEIIQVTIPSIVFGTEHLFDERLAEFSYHDGFDSPEAFRDYFVPNAGDVFKGILYKW